MDAEGNFIKKHDVDRIQSRLDKLVAMAKRRYSGACCELVQALFLVRGILFGSHFRREESDRAAVESQIMVSPLRPR